MSEPFPFDDESDEGGNEQQEGQNQSFKDLRDYADRLEKKLKSAEKVAEDLSTKLEVYTSREREATITNVFTEVGLNPKHGELFKRVNPDLKADQVTTDVVTEFAKEYELVTAPQAPSEDSVPAPAGFQPPKLEGTPLSDKLTPEDIQTMLRNGDFGKIQEAYEGGRVEQDSVPWRKFQDEK